MPLRASPPEHPAETNAEPPCEGLLGIREAASRACVSERTLRYYQQLGLLTPAGHTPGGLRRYSPEDLARVRRARDLQTLLGLNLDEIGVVFTHEDRLAEIRRAYRAAAPGDPRRRELIGEALALYGQLRTTVETKLTSLQTFLDDLDASIGRARDLLAEIDTGSSER